MLIRYKIKQQKSGIVKVQLPIIKSKQCQVPQTPPTIMDAAPRLHLTRK